MALGKLAGGTPSLNGNLIVGAVKEVEPPELNYSMLQTEALGMSGAVELPLQLEVMEASITWLYLPPEVRSAVFDPVKRSLFVLDIDQQITSATGDPVFELLRYTMSLTAKETGLGTYAATEAAEPETTHVCHYFKFEANGSLVFEANPYSPKGIKIGESIARLF